MNEETRADFMLRTRIVSAVRRFLDQDGFIEVETPILQPRYGGAFAEPFVTHHNVLDQISTSGSRPSSTQRLIVVASSGCTRSARTFATRESTTSRQSRVHNARVVRGVRGLPRHHAAHRESDRVRARETARHHDHAFKGNEVDLKAPWKRVKLIDELREFDLWTKDYDDLKQRLESRGVDVSQDTGRGRSSSTRRSRRYVEPDGLVHPTILYDYPIELSPFARVTDDDPEIVRAGSSTTSAAWRSATPSRS